MFLKINNSKQREKIVNEFLKTRKNIKQKVPDSWSKRRGFESRLRYAALPHIHCFRQTPAGSAWHYTKPRPNG